MPAFEFHSEDLSRLRRLTFAARIPAMVKQEGQHRTRRAGEGLEFLDYRPYVPGDDLRHVDWNLYGRLRQLIVRVFESQENLSVSLLVDTSRSMSFGEPVTKAAHACRIACAFAYVALSEGERLSVASIGAGLGSILGPLQRKRALGQVVEYLQQSPAENATNLYDCIHTYCTRLRRKGLVVIVSDFLVADGYSRALQRLMSRGCKLLVVQVLDQTDLGGKLQGYLRLRDSETGEERVTFVDDATRNQLARAARKYCDGLAAFCRNYRQQYIQTYTHEDYLEVVCNALRAETAVR